MIEKKFVERQQARPSSGESALACMLTYDEQSYKGWMRAAVLMAELSRAQRCSHTIHPLSNLVAMLLLHESWCTSFKTALASSADKMLDSAVACSDLWDAFSIGACSSITIQHET